MMNLSIPATRDLALWLRAREGIVGEPSEIEEMHATLRVCEKLRQPLSTLTGAAGYRSLISRALTLAKKEAPSLEKVQVKKDGSLEWTAAVKPQQGMDEAVKGGAVLVAQLLGLLVTFIGQALTVRLVRDLWPDAPFKGINPKTENSYERTRQSAHPQTADRGSGS
jgi:hypothetical protein